MKTFNITGNGTTEEFELGDGIARMDGFGVIDGATIALQVNSVASGLGRWKQFDSESTITTDDGGFDFRSASGRYRVVTTGAGGSTDVVVNIGAFMD